MSRVDTNFYFFKREPSFFTANDFIDVVDVSKSRDSNEYSFWVIKTSILRIQLSLKMASKKYKLYAILFYVVVIILGLFYKIFILEEIQ